MRDPYLPYSHPVRRTGRVRIEVGARSAWLYGAGLAAVLDELGIPRMRDWHPARRRALMCPMNRVDDLLAIIEYRDGRTADVTAVNR